MERLDWEMWSLSRISSTMLLFRRDSAQCTSSAFVQKKAYIGGCIGRSNANGSNLKTKLNTPPLQQTVRTAWSICKETSISSCSLFRLPCEQRFIIYICRDCEMQGFTQGH